MAEVRKCRHSLPYFADSFCQIVREEGEGGAWVPFALWKDQLSTARVLQDDRLVVCLKARQLGLTWLVLAYSLWLMLFHPAATVLLFSRRDDEATELLSGRLRGMYDRLPPWLKARGIVVDNDHEWKLTNGSRAMAFPTTAGDSYTATLAVVDEADLVPDLDRLMGAVKPTIDAGGRMVLLSRADKGRPESPFKRVYRAARAGLNGWTPVFLPWHSRPGRDAAWYESQRADVLHRTGSLDELHGQYPATDAEALSPRTLDKRIAPAWVQECYRDARPVDRHDGPAVPGLVVYATPAAGRRYVIGADPAEGNPTSDDSALEVLDAESGEEVACLAGKYQPQVLAAYAARLSAWYNRAGVLVERNNHGHAVLGWLRDNAPEVRRLAGQDGKEGWLSSSLGKTLLYDACADAFRNGEVVLHDFATLTQLQAVDGSTLRAPEGQSDDRADAFALAVMARVKGRVTTYRTSK